MRKIKGVITMENLKSLSLLVLETIMTDCLIRMESSTNSLYIEKQIQLFREIEQEMIKRG